MTTKTMATAEAVPPRVSATPELSFRSGLIKDFCESFNSLEDGEYLAPPSEESIAKAWELYCRLNIRHVLPTRIFPSPEGGVALCFSRGGRYADFECFNMGKTMVAMSDRRGTVQVFEVDLRDEKEVDNVIFGIGQFLDSSQDALPFAPTSR